MLAAQTGPQARSGQNPGAAQAAGPGPGFTWGLASLVLNLSQATSAPRRGRASPSLQAPRLRASCRVRVLNQGTERAWAMPPASCGAGVPDLAREPPTSAPAPTKGGPGWKTCRRVQGVGLPCRTPRPRRWRAQAAPRSGTGCSAGWSLHCGPPA